MLSVTVASFWPSRYTLKSVPVRPVAEEPVASCPRRRQLRKTPSEVPAAASPRSRKSSCTPVVAGFCEGSTAAAGVVRQPTVRARPAAVATEKRRTEVRFGFISESFQFGMGKRFPSNLVRLRATNQALVPGPNPEYLERCRRRDYADLAYDRGWGWADVRSLGRVTVRVSVPGCRRVDLRRCLAVPASLATLAAPVGPASPIGPGLSDPRIRPVPTAASLPAGSRGRRTAPQAW